MSVCIGCGRKFEQRSDYTKRYCSHECYIKFKRENAHTSVCRVCGKTFRCSPAERGYYCSPECSRLGRRNGKNVPCDVCGKKIYVPKYEFKFEHHFCSNQCRMKWTVKEQLPSVSIKKDSNATDNWYKTINGRLAHRVVMEKIIGRPLTSTEVVHHIDGDKSNNSPYNLMLFKNKAEHCKWHHKLSANEAGGGE